MAENVCILPLTPSKSTDVVAELIESADKSKPVAYQVILSQPKVDEAPPVNILSPLKTHSIDNIVQKLTTAEERRASLDAMRQARFQDKNAKLEEVRSKRNEFENNFINTVKETLQTKIATTQENREEYINTLKTKLKEHEDKVSSVRKSIELAKEEMKENIEKKLATATENRDERLHKMLDKLREHTETIQQVQQTQEEKLHKLQEEIEKKLEKKLEIATENREAYIQKKLEPITKHTEHVEEVSRSKSNTSITNNGN